MNSDVNMKDLPYGDSDTEVVFVTGPADNCSDCSCLKYTPPIEVDGDRIKR